MSEVVIKILQGIGVIFQQCHRAEIVYLIIFYCNFGH